LQNNIWIGGHFKKGKPSVKRDVFFFRCALRRTFLMGKSREFCKPLWVEAFETHQQEITKATIMDKATKNVPVKNGKSR